MYCFVLTICSKLSLTTKRRRWPATKSARALRAVSLPYTVCTVGSVYSGYLVPSTTHTEYSQYTDKSLTSFWSTIGSIWHLGTKFDNFLQWFCVPHVFGVLTDIHKQDMYFQTNIFTKQRHVWEKGRRNKNHKMWQACSALHWLGDTNTYKVVICFN